MSEISNDESNELANRKVVSGEVFGFQKDLDAKTVVLDQMAKGYADAQEAIERLRAEIAYSQQQLAAAQLTIQVVRALIKPVMPPNPEAGLSDTEWAYQSGRNQMAQYIRDGIGDV